MDIIYLKLVCLIACWRYGDTCKPLHLTPFIDEGNLCAALQLSEVKDPLMIIPRSYSGFITTDRDRGNHLFFWFFPASNNTEAPLVVWLNGGPGVSSMFGLLYENGPIIMKELDSGEVIYERRPQSWSEPFSMLYIDNPVGVGYSYSETNSTKTTQDEYSQELYLFIEQFYLMFPEYLHRELYIGGQSYAGKYVPAFAHRIHTKIMEKKSVIPLTGIYLGGPYFDPLIQGAQSCDYFYSMGVISHFQLLECMQEKNELYDLVKNGNLQDLDYNKFIRNAFPYKLQMFSANVVTHEDTYYLYVMIRKIMTKIRMRGILHVFSAKYTALNDELHLKFTPDLLVSTKSKLADLLDNYKVLVYTGDYDDIVTSPMVEAGLMSTSWSLQEQYNNSSRSVWNVGEKIKGFYTKTGQFCRVVIHGAGHQTPHDQPESTLEMMINFVQHGCI